MATNNQKTDLLFKQFTGVVNASQLDPFSNSNSNKFPFQPYILGQDVLIENIPNDLSNISYPDPDNVGDFVYGIHALDLSFQSLNYTMGISYEIPNTPLIYYYKIQLEPALDTTPRTFYKDDGTNTNSSLLKYSIPFLYDPIYKSYFQRVYTNDGNGRINMYSGDLLWLFDYKSGFLQFYGSDTSVIQNWVNTHGPPRISVIVYNGNKGLENFSGGGGGGGGLTIDGEINFVANDENISKIKSTYDGSESSIKFSVLNNSLLEDIVTINKEGIDISGNITINEIIFSGSYNDLNDRPSLFSGSYNDLTNRPSLFSGSYNDLTNRPTIPTNNNQLTNGASYITYNSNTKLNSLSIHTFYENGYNGYNFNTRRNFTITNTGTIDEAIILNDCTDGIIMNNYTGTLSNHSWRIVIESHSNRYLYFKFWGAGADYTGAPYYTSWINTGYIAWNYQNRLMNFTGQHRCFLNNKLSNSYEGLIVSVKGNYINLDNSIKPTINDSLPYCELTKKYKDPSIFGVISDLEDRERSFGAGNFVSLYEKANVNEHRFFINSIGEGSIWVCNYKGNLKIGDYIVSSSIDGYGCKQDDDILHNYTVAKITCECNFNLNLVSKKKVKIEKKIINIEEDVYENILENTEKKKIIFNEELQRYIEESFIETTSKRELVYDTYDLYDKYGNIIGVHSVKRKEIIQKEENYIVYDENGDIVFEDDLDENGNIQYEYEYETRFLDENANILSGEEEYLSRLNNGENVYIACFVGCTYHCG